MGVFTDHIRDFPDHAGSAFNELRTVLRRALEQRKIENPEYLGFTATKWNEEDREDLLMGCYEWAILAKLGGLRDQLKRKPNVDQIVAGNVWRFLTEQQKKTNPLRYVVFVNCAASITQLVCSGDVFVNTKKIDNYTFVALKEGETRESLPDLIGKAIANSAEWSDVTTLLINRKGESRPAQKQLSTLIPELAQKQILAFILRSLTDEITAICKQKSVEILENQATTKKSEKKHTGNRIFGLDLGYLDIEGGDPSPWLDKLNDLKQKIDLQTKSKKVAKRLVGIVDYLIELVEQKTDIEKIGWPEIGEHLGIRRQRVYEDRDRLISIMSDNND